MFKRKRTVFPIIMIIMLAFQMMSPVTVLADDGTPPSAAEIPVPAEETDASETDAGTTTEETPVTTEETSTSENDAVTSAEEIPVPDETTPTPETTDSATETAPMAEPETEADLTVAEALEQAPEGTDLVVVNEEGELEPLATEEAAEIVAEADPIWCSDGTTPTTINSAAHCSPSYTTMTELLIWLTANNPNVAGTIWIEKTYDSAAEDVAGFTLDGTVLTNMANIIA